MNAYDAPSHQHLNTNTSHQQNYLAEEVCIRHVRGGGGNFILLLPHNIYWLLSGTREAKGGRSVFGAALSGIRPDTKEETSKPEQDTHDTGKQL